MVPSSRADCLDENAALALVDGSIDAAARARLEQHLSGCDGCRELVAELARGFEPDEPAAAPDTDRGVRELTGALLGGRYRVETPIGSGSAGTVYRARDERTSEIVAVKLVTDSALAHRFEREAATLARLDHPAIVRYVAHGQAPGGFFLAMEWLAGEDLEQRLRRGRIGWEAARALGLRLSAALAHAHALGVVHRDLGPRNVFLPGGRIEDAKLLDFGLVRLPDGHSLERTASQAILGTPYYMAPEQVKDPRRVDARADLFALGVLLFEAISGQRPFEGADLFTLWANIVDAAPPELRRLAPETPPAFLALVDALLAKSPDARPASAEVVYGALTTLEVAAAPTAPLARPMQAWPRGGPPTAPVGPPTPMVAPPTSRVGPPTPMVAPPTSRVGPPTPMVAPRAVSSGPPTPSAAPWPASGPGPTVALHATAPGPRPTSGAGAPAPVASAPPPPWWPPPSAPTGQVLAPTPPPPGAERRSNGAVIFAAVAAVLSLVVAGIVVAYVLHRRAESAEANAPTEASAPAPATAPSAVIAAAPLAPVSPTTATAPAPGRPPAPRPPGSAAPAPPGSAPSPAPSHAPSGPGAEIHTGTHYFCGGNSSSHERGGTYAPSATAEEPAVSIGGSCTAVLENCTIHGQTGVMIGDHGTLTLRNCQVDGAAMVMANGTLVLERTTIRGALTKLGYARVIVK